MIDTDTKTYEDVRAINVPVQINQGGIRGDDKDAGQAAAAEIANEFGYGALEALARGYTENDIQLAAGSATLDAKQHEERAKRKRPFQRIMKGFRGSMVLEQSKNSQKIDLEWASVWRANVRNSTGK